jgi:hypothetical protein
MMLILELSLSYFSPKILSLTDGIAESIRDTFPENPKKFGCDDEL